MNNPNHKTTDNMLLRVQNGMEVFDSTRQKIGTVAYVQFGDEDPTHPGVETATNVDYANHPSSFIEEIAEVFADNHNIPEELISRLQRYGYVRVSTGLLQNDCFVTPDQLAQVTDERVELNTPAEDLLSL